MFKFLLNIIFFLRNGWSATAHCNRMVTFPSMSLATLLQTLHTITQQLNFAIAKDGLLKTNKVKCQKYVILFKKLSLEIILSLLCVALCKSAN